MYRRAWRMTLLPGGEASYDKAHANIWPELIADMRDGGVETFVIFRDGADVFAFQERSSEFPGPEAAPSLTMQRWWQEMEPLMVTGSDGRPMRTMLGEVFVLENKAAKT